MSGKQRYLLRVRLLRSLPNVHTTRHPPPETCREYERVVDAKYLDQIRTQAKQFSTRSLSRLSGVANCAIITFKKRKNTIKPPTLRKLRKANL